MVDTDSYAGNFERELGSYITGHLHDNCRHSRELTQEIKAALGDRWDEILEPAFVQSKAPFHDYMQLANIYPTPGYELGKNGDPKKIPVGQVPKHPSYQSVIIRTGEKPNKELLDILKEWSHKFAEKSQQKDKQPDDFMHFIEPFKIIGFRLICEVTTTKEEDLGL